MKAVYPGTFDPITLGHIDVIERAGKMFDKVIVGIATNPQKKPMFSIEERTKMVEESVKGFGNIEVKTFDGLLVEFAKEEEAKVIIRGLREMMDFAEEFQRTIANRILDAGIETVFIVTNEKYFYLNSSIVKEIASLGGHLEAFVPKNVENALCRKFQEGNIKG